MQTIEFAPSDAQPETASGFIATPKYFLGLLDSDVREIREPNYFRRPLAGKMVRHPTDPNRATNSGRVSFDVPLTMNQPKWGLVRYLGIYRGNDLLQTIDLNEGKGVLMESGDSLVCGPRKINCLAFPGMVKALDFVELLDIPDGANDVSFPMTLTELEPKEDS